MKARSNVYFWGFLITLCVVIIDTSGLSNYQTRPRATRGFKNAALSTARGFGKRDGFARNSDSTMDLLFDLKKNANENLAKDLQTSERFSVDWFVEELSKNPRLAKLLNKKLVDKDQADADELSSQELMQNIEY